MLASDASRKNSGAGEFVDKRRETSRFDRKDFKTLSVLQILDLVVNKLLVLELLRVHPRGLSLHVAKDTSGNAVAREGVAFE